MISLHADFCTELVISPMLAVLFLNIDVFFKMLTKYSIYYQSPTLASLNSNVTFDLMI